MRVVFNQAASYATKSLHWAVDDRVPDNTRVLSTLFAMVQSAHGMGEGFHLWFHTPLSSHCSDDTLTCRRR